MNAETERLLGAHVARLRLAWAASVLGVLVFAGLGAALAGTLEGVGGAQAPSAWATAVAACGFVAALAVLLLDRRLHAPGRVAARARHPFPEHVLRHLTVSHLVLWSLAEVPAILGLVHVVIGGAPRTLLLLCAVALGLLAALMPSRGRLAGQLEGALRP